MNVFFISSGNIHSLNPIIENQGESLKQAGIMLEYFTIKGKGIKGYLKNILPLRKKIQVGNYDLLHAHYSLSAFTASLTLKRPLVVSLMGSDVYASGFMLRLIRFLSKRWWNVTIVKSEEMREKLRLPEAMVIPNGVNTALFKPITRTESLVKLGWELDKKHVLFPANKEREVKNFGLAKQAVEMLDDPALHLHSLENVPNSLMPLYYNAADVVLMTSHWEGSPNAIKEAMACNAPIVATDVGDIKANLQGVVNCHITYADPASITACLQKVLEKGERSDGRNRIFELDLEAGKIAEHLIEIYKSAMKHKTS
jgi:glycosyltransferase involved in cell wall biosynthesis